MLKKLLGRNSKRILLAVVIVALVAALGYLVVTLKHFFYSKAENYLVKQIESSGYRITYDSFSADNILMPEQITATNAVLRKIDSSVVVKSPKLTVTFTDNNFDARITKPELSFTMRGLSSSDDSAWVIKAEADVSIINTDSIFEISLPQQLTLASDLRWQDMILSFAETPVLIYTHNMHEHTGEVISRTLDLKPNLVTVTTVNSDSSLTFDSTKLYFSYNNLGFNQTTDIKLNQIISSYDASGNLVKDSTTNLELNLVYKNTLVTDVNNILKLESLSVVNNNFTAHIQADLRNTSSDIIPTGTIAIQLSNIDFFIGKIYESIVTDKVAPQYIKNEKFHRVYNMQSKEFNTKLRQFVNFLNNNNNANSGQFSLAIKRETNAAILLNQNSLQSALQQFDQIFFK